ncbi:MAG: lipocalin-like domain-containing protein [Pseudomonadota bacterium]
MPVSPFQSHQQEQGIAVANALGGYNDTKGYERALTVRPFDFPVDHGAHPSFRNEWWYATGNVFDAHGRHFGYQLTLFRIAIKPPDEEKPDSAWRTRQIYMGHFALTDVANGQHYHDEKFSRASLGLAGARNKPFRVWLEDWSFISESDAFLPLHTAASTPGFAINFLLQNAKPLVLQGNKGLSQKSPEPGNASYYYSFTRLPTTGTVRIGEQSFQVSGDSWLDREWSTSVLGPKQQGWDWFALQLEDGREIMFYQLRHEDNSIDQLSQGVLVEKDGSYRKLNLEDVELKPQTIWHSPQTKRKYPIEWRMNILSAQLSLNIRAALENQEMLATVQYWEGAVVVEGTAKGYGYLEMTGYRKD